MEIETDTPITFFNPWSEIETSHNRLPHWEQAGATYFLTWRLADSIPQNLFQQLKEEQADWLKDHPEPHSAEVSVEYHRIFSSKLDYWMDEGHGTCRLREPEIGELMSSAFLHFDTKRYVMHSFVVMPNHVHLLFSIAENENLSDIVHS